MPKQLFQVFQSAAIFAGDVRPRIELPAIGFEREGAPNELVEGLVRVEVIAGRHDAVCERFLGVAAAEDYIVLVVPSEDYEQLCERVRTIRAEPLKFRAELDEFNQIVAASFDGRPVRFPPRRSETVGGELDYELEKKSG